MSLKTLQNKRGVGEALGNKVRIGFTLLILFTANFSFSKDIKF